MPPFLIVIISMFFIPNNYYKPYYAPTVALSFWVIYYIWNFMADKKNKKNIDHHS